MIRLILLLLASFILISCGTTNTAQKLISNINKDLKAKYNIEYGSLIAAYDLVKIHNTKCIYAKDYGRIINDESYNKIFLNKFKIRYKNFTNLENEAKIKILRIKDLALKLDNKYRLFSNHELNILKQRFHRENDIFSFIKTEKTADYILELLKLDKIISKIPIMLPEYQARVTSHYGIRSHPIKCKRKFHCGTDLVGAKSTAVYSAADGVIAMVGRLNGYGNIVEIKHSGKVRTKYTHLKEIFVSEGDQVLRGEKIGLQGNTGDTTAEHLHFEIWLNNKHVDPFDFIVHACRC